jgi:hypothetical protein
MTTRLTKSELSTVQNQLTAVLDNGIKFIECPLSDEDKSIFWHKAFPDDLLTAYTTLHEHGVGVEYAATTRSVGFTTPKKAGEVYAVRLCLTDAQRGFFTITQKMLDAWDTVTLENDQYTSWPLLSTKIIEERMGLPMAEQFFEWINTCSIMDDEVSNAQTVLEDLLGMIKTAGQLHRMVPDLFQYMPKDTRDAFADQKRTSHAPFEWAAYDRDNVEKMIGTLHKCWLLKDLAKPSMQTASRGSDSFSWPTTRKILKSKDE